jgi:hypothetical protein
MTASHLDWDFCSRVRPCQVHRLMPSRVKPGNAEHDGIRRSVSTSAVTPCHSPDGKLQPGEIGCIVGGKQVRCAT